MPWILPILGYVAKAGAAYSAVNSVVRVTDGARGGDVMPQPVAETGTGTKDAQNQASAVVKDKRRAAARSRTVYTSPLGKSEEANIARKTLLGQ